MRLIDADALRNRIIKDYRKEFFGSVLWNILDDMPTIDAVPVVRCMDCKKRQDPRECPMCFTEVEDIEGGRMYKFTDLTRPDGFCHMGAKMDGGAE